MRATAPLLLLLALLPTTACLSSESDKGDEEDLPSDGSGKEDSFRKPTDHGPIEFGVAAHTVLTDDERHHTWTFELSGDANVDLTTSYSLLGQRKTDTVLYLYKEGPTGWGPYIARNDDYGGKVYSQLIRSLGAGRYRALVKGYLATTRGKFKLTVGCTGDGCVPAVEPGGCLFGDTYGDLEGNPALAIDNRNVITAATLGNLTAEDQQRLMVAVQQSAHVDVTTPLEAIGRVDGGEVNVTWMHEPAARRSFIAFEYGAGDNSYGAIFDRHTGALVTPIHDGDLLGCTVVAETCLLPEDYTALRADPAFVPELARTITSGAQVYDVEAEQVLSALRRSFASVTTIDQGLAFVDDGRVHLDLYRHAPTGTYLMLVEYGAGDTSLGTIYYADSLVIAGIINDLYIEGCSLFEAHGVGTAAAGELCRAATECGAGLTCHGRFAGAGVCGATARVAGEGDECASDAACGSPDLICAGASRGYGMCAPSWMRGSFEDAATSAIPDAGVLVRRLSVRGLATVDTDVHLRLTIDHPRASQLRITLTNPATNEVLVHDGGAADDGHPLVIDRPILNGFSGDESVNGEWTLRVTDRASGQTGTLAGWTLTVTSRWD